MTKQSYTKEEWQKICDRLEETHTGLARWLKMESSVSINENPSFSLTNAELNIVSDAAKNVLETTVEPVNYRELLKKYMQHVLDEEGTTFVDSGYSWTQTVLTPEGKAELLKIKAEMIEERG